MKPLEFKQRKVLFVSAADSMFYNLLIKPPRSVHTLRLNGHPTRLGTSSVPVVVRGCTGPRSVLMG